MRGDLQESGRTREQLHYQEAHPSGDDSSDLLNHRKRVESAELAASYAESSRVAVFTHTDYKCVLLG